jgi:hypothetical protein
MKFIPKEERFFPSFRTVEVFQLPKRQITHLDINSPGLLEVSSLPFATLPDTGKMEKYAPLHILLTVDC